MSPFCHLEILVPAKMLWKDDPDCNLAIRQFLVRISVVIQDVERELAAERASSREAVGPSWLLFLLWFFLKVKFVAVLQNTGTTAAETAEGRVAVSGYQISSTASMEHCRSSPGKQRSFDAPSVLFRLQVAEASLEKERAKLHEATQNQVQGEAFQNLKRLAKKMCWQQAHSLDHQTSIAIKRRWCRPSVILRFLFLRRYFEKMIQIAIWQFGNF